MCIFCGGTCGGVGDALMPVVGIGISMAIAKARTLKQRKTGSKSPDIEAVDNNGLDSSASGQAPISPLA